MRSGKNTLRLREILMSKVDEILGKLSNKSLGVIYRGIKNEEIVSSAVQEIGAGVASVRNRSHESVVRQVLLQPNNGRKTEDH